MPFLSADVSDGRNDPYRSCNCPNPNASSLRAMGVSSGSQVGLALSRSAEIQTANSYDDGPKCSLDAAASRLLF